MSKIFQVILEQHEIFLFPYPFFLFGILLLAIGLLKQLSNPWTSSTKLALPPSPPKLPIIGNLHNLGLHPHRSLRALAQQFGPLMLLHFGSVPVLVVSSADAAREIMKTHDAAFADRPKSSSTEKLFFGPRDVAFVPYGEYWRQMKSVCVQHLLSNKRVNSFRAVREEETALAIEKIEKSMISSSSPVNLTDIFGLLSNNVICRASLGRKYDEGEAGDKFNKLFRELVALVGNFDVGDYIPWLAWISRVNGLMAKMEKLAKASDAILEEVIDEHVNRHTNNGNNTGLQHEDQRDLMDVLLEIQRENTAGFPIERISIKALLWDMLAGGTDTTSTIMEWTMTELLRNPKIMKKLKSEIKQVVGEKSDISEDDVDTMHYLKAVIKESLRLHPPVAMLLPRLCAKDHVKIKGYDIARGTQVIINAWAIGRDPASWARPEEFIPDRFLENPIDFKGHDFELIPFGAGRRICPGIQFTIKLNELFLANLVHKFEWSTLPSGTKEQDLDMAETCGVTVHRKHPLIAVGNPCF